MESEIVGKKKEIELRSLGMESMLSDKEISVSKTADEVALGLITPSPDRENKTTSFIPSSPDSDQIGTPSANVFDPFAPGSDDLLLTPKKIKRLKETRIGLVRRLDFESFIDLKENFEDYVHEEERFLESMYESLLDAIISKEVEMILAENCLPKFDLSTNLNTPTSSPLLTGIAETCPGAPTKHKGKSRNFDFGVCRKLEF